MKWYDIYDKQTLKSVMPKPVKKVLVACYGSERKFYDSMGLYAERVEVLKSLDALLRYAPSQEELDQLNAAGALAETVEETTIREELLAAQDAEVRRRRGLQHFDDMLLREKEERAETAKKGRKK